MQEHKQWQKESARGQARGKYHCGGGFGFQTDTRPLAPMYQHGKTDVLKIRSVFGFTTGTGSETLINRITNK
jgi:hypothetical protein